MSEKERQVNNLPAVSADEPASEGQVKMLKDISKFKEGITKEEASAIISAYINANSIPAGLHLFKIDSIEEATKSDGSLMTDKNGNPGLRITFRNKPDPAYGNILGKISDNFYYPATINNVCASDFKLRKLKLALGVKPNETQNIEILKKLTFWGIVQEVHHIDESSNPVCDRENKPIISKNLLAEYYAGTMDRPSIEGDPAGNKGKAGGKFYSTRVIKAKESSGEKQKSVESTETESKVDDGGDWS